MKFDHKIMGWDVSPDLSTQIVPNLVFTYSSLVSTFKSVHGTFFYLSLSKVDGILKLKGIPAGIEPVCTLGLITF